MIPRDYALKAWRDKVLDRFEEIDPNGEHDWLDLAYGFFLGCGLAKDLAFELSEEVNSQ